MRGPLQPLQPLQKAQLQPPFGPSVDSLCHPCITTHLSYSVLSLKLPPPPCTVLLVWPGRLIATCGAVVWVSVQSLSSAPFHLHEGRAMMSTFSMPPGSFSNDLQIVIASGQSNVPWIFMKFDGVWMAYLWGYIMIQWHMALYSIYLYSQIFCILGIAQCIIATGNSLSNPLGDRYVHWKDGSFLTGMRYWLVVSTPLKNISQLGWLFPIYGKIKLLFQTTNQAKRIDSLSPV